MALINQNEVFDRLKEYIDVKITNLPDQVEEVLKEYGFKIVADNIDAVLLVAENMTEVIAVAAISDEIITITNPLVLEAILGAEENALISQSAAWEAEAEAMTADSYAMQGVNETVIEYTSNGDGTFAEITTTKYSSYHWSIMSAVAAEGLDIQGIWNIESHLDPLTEPPAPTTMDDPENPGTPLPYQNGMYWYVVGKSIYDPNGTGIEPYPTYGPAQGLYKTDDRIVYMNNSSVPYNPWLRLADVIQWDRIISIPLNVSNALDAKGIEADAKMTGGLLIESSGPTLALNNTGTVDKNIVFTSDDTAFGIVTVNDIGSYMSTVIQVEFDAFMLELTASGMRYNSSTVWTSENDGIGSALDAGLLEGIRSSGFALAGLVVSGSVTAITAAGMYIINDGTSDLPSGFSGVGSLVVTGDGVTNVIHTLVSAGTSSDQWVNTFTSAVWSGWKQLGYMSFDGTILNITL